MTKNEAEEHLKKSTVKIDSPSDVGSGFFIDQDLIATCHHVVEGCSASELEIVWQGSSYQATSIESNPEDDLALVSVKINKKHPCVQIDKRIETGDECFTFGFPEAYRDIGDTLTFVSEGHNEKFLKFKEGQFESGFSGAPILNYRTLKVCGVVKRTRDEHFDFIGGRGIPISKLFDFEGLDIDDNGSIFSKEMFKNWVWTSSVESADRLQFSVLALVETLVAVGISLFFWIYLGVYWHIITGLVITPLYFLRSKKSEEDAIVLFFKFLNFLSVYNQKKNYTKILFKIVIFLLKVCLIIYFYLIFLTLYLYFGDPSIGFFMLYVQPFYLFEYLIIKSPENIPLTFITLFVLSLFINKILVLSLLSKVYITFKNLFKIKRIPKNWLKATFVVDIISPLEILPSIENRKVSNHLLLKEYYYSISYIYSKKIIQDSKIPYEESKIMNFFIPILNVLEYISIIFVRVISIITMIIPILFIRYIIKSTAWIYLPLIWLIQPQDRENLTTRLKIESKNFIAYLMFLYSIIVVFVFTLLPLIFPHTELGVYLQTLAIPETLKTIFFAYEFNLWHLTRFLSALITIVFMVSFTKILIRRETEPSYGDFWGAKLLSLRAVRSVLTLITLGFTAYHILGLLPDGFFVNLFENMKISPES